DPDPYLCCHYISNPSLAHVSLRDIMLTIYSEPILSAVPEPQTHAMLLAGFIAFALIALTMIVMYRLPGAVAVIALAGQAILMIASLTGFFRVFPAFTLTLPGLAGIILSIGFGVDANVITAERIKEELRNGRSVDGAIDAGFQRAFSAILDSNVTVIIVAVILMGAFGPPDSLFARILTPVFFMFGPSAAGTIYSFGYTLLVGVILNLVMGVLASRLMLKSLSRFAALRNPALYCGHKTGKDWSIGFIAKQKLWFGISLGLMVVMLVGVAVFGIDFDIQFKGGALITYSYNGDVDKAQFQQDIEEVLGQTVNLQESVDVVTGSKNFVISMPTTDGINVDTQMELSRVLGEKYAANGMQTVSTSVVSPTIGGEFLRKCFIALLFASLMMALYISLRFRRIGGWSAGVTALCALLHDVLMIFAVFVLFRIPINTNFIAVSLTILGYSLNDTIVIYDRIRENKRLYSAMPMTEMVDKSLNQSFTRSLMTSVTTVTAMVVVTLVALVFNVDSILSFSFPLIIGMVSGFYSSVCIAPNLWVIWQQKKAAKAPRA
ncbi:MAG: protein translocase subunit SecF, partial [Oscillospiraceae bacterium]